MTRGRIMRNSGLIGGTVLLTLVCIILGAILFHYILYDEEEASLTVSEAYFIGREGTQEEMMIDVDVWVTNEGKGDADTVTVNVFAIETDSNLARANSSIQIGGLKGERSAKTRLTMDVPLNDTYRVEVLVFKDGKLTITGSGIIDLTKGGYPRDYSTDRNLDQEEVEEKGAEVADSLCAVVGIIGMGVLVLVIVMLVTLTTKDDGAPGAGTKVTPERLRMPVKEDEERTDASPLKGSEKRTEEDESRGSETSAEDGRVHARMPRSLE